MSNESLLKIGLIITVFIAICFYHITNFFSVSDSDFFTLVKISQFAVIAIFIGFAVWTQMVPKFIIQLIPSEGFIGGKYIGVSSDFQVQPDDTHKHEPQHRETFSIKQTLFETIVNGVSKREGEDDIYSTWFGRRFHVHGDTHYFGIIITTPNSSESGVLQMTINGNNDIVGFYFSGDPNSTKRCRFSAERVKV